jgi:hypothetical protein
MNANEAIGKIRFMLDVGGSDGFTSADKEALNMAINALSAEITAPPKSNADRIRQMTDEELFVFLNEITDCCFSNNDCDNCPMKYSDELYRCNIEAWLKQEVQDNE